MSPVQLDNYATGIARRILGAACETNTEAKRIVHDALAAGVDPMQRFARVAGQSEAVVFARAAEAIGLVFVEAVPEAVKLKGGGAEIDRLAKVQSVRGVLFDREVLFVAPGFQRLVALGRRVRREPDMARQVCLVPPRQLRAHLARLYAEGLTRRALTRLAARWPHASAHRELTLKVRAGFAALLLAAAILAALLPELVLGVVAPILAVLYLAPAALRLIAALLGTFNPVREAIPRLAEAELPAYSVMVPLRDEAELVPQLVNAMLALDYPRDRLDIKFIVEQASRETVEAVREHLWRGPFELVEVPDGQPLTKPKALNFALPLATGELLVIFDAEDVPEPDQLRLAAAKFAAHHELDCLQAELVIDNAPESLLTALFTAEYAAQFGLILPALAMLGLPMPLGGTSNHFRMRALIEAGGWDSYNVTEDADLGVRLARLRYRCGTLVSATYEEAPVTLGGWLTQRTRWMKGWMQTLIVHNQKPLKLLEDLGLLRFLAFEIYVGGLVFTAPVHALFVGLLAWRVGTGGGEWALRGDYWSVFFATVLVLGYASAILIALLGLKRFGRLKLGWAQILLPLYWILTSLAAIRAGVQLVTNPFVWEKTRHARTKLERRRFAARTDGALPREIEAT